MDIINNYLVFCKQQKINLEAVKKLIFMKILSISAMEKFLIKREYKELIKTNSKSEAKFILADKYYKSFSRIEGIVYNQFQPF